MLNDLIGRVEQTQLTEKDPEAEQLLNQRLGRNPNALYVLAQTVLVQKYALEQAKAQLTQLRQQQPTNLQQQPARTTSFLGSLLGHQDPAPPPPPRLRLPPGYGAPPYGQPWKQAPAYGPVRHHSRGWVELSAHRRHHCGRGRCGGARLSGGGIVDCTVLVATRPVSAAVDSLAGVVRRRRPSSTTTTMMPGRAAGAHRE